MAISMPQRRPSGTAGASAPPSRAPSSGGPPVAPLRHPDQQGAGSKLGGGAALPTGGLRRLYRFLAWVAATAIALPVSLASELLLRPRRTHPEPNAGAGQAADAGVAGGDAAWQQAGSRQQEVTPDAAVISGDNLGDAVALSTAEDSGGGVGFGLPFAGLLRWLVVDLLWGYVVHPVWDVVSDVAAYYWSGEGADRCRKCFLVSPPTPSSATCLLVRRLLLPFSTCLGAGMPCRLSIRPRPRTASQPRPSRVLGRRRARVPSGAGRQARNAVGSQLRRVVAPRTPR